PLGQTGLTQRLLLGNCSTPRKRFCRPTTLVLLQFAADLADPPVGPVLDLGQPGLHLVVLALPGVSLEGLRLVADGLGVIDPVTGGQGRPRFLVPRELRHRGNLALGYSPHGPPAAPRSVPEVCGLASFSRCLVPALFRDRPRRRGLGPVARDA